MENANWLVTEWNVSLADVVQAMADVKPQMEFAPIDEAPKTELLWWKQQFSVARDSPLWVGASETTWAAIGLLVLTSAGVESPPLAELRSTYLEIVGQSMGTLARELGNRLSTEVTCDEGGDSQPEPSSNRMFEVTATITGAQQLSFYVIVGENLANALSPPQPVSVPPEQAGQFSPAGELAHAAGSRTFELLLDVELPISVSFGRTSLRVQEAMNLVSGSLIELDRAVTDPVELLVNNCVIARGEVVVIEGNYGIRLTEIVSQKERLQQSRRYMLT